MKKIPSVEATLRKVQSSKFVKKTNLKMHLSRGLACSQKMSSLVAILFCASVFSVGPLGPIGGVESKSVDQQEQPSCDHVIGFFSSINVTIVPANKNQGKCTFNELSSG